MTSSHTTRPEAPRVVQAAVLVALFCGGLDIALAILNRAQSFENLMLIFPSMYATAALLALLFLGAWWAVLRPIGTRLDADLGALQNALAVALAVTFVCARIAQLSARELSADALFMLALFASFGVGLGAAAYLATQALQASSKLAAQARAVVLLGPAVMTVMLLLLWAQLYWIESIKSLLGWLSCVLFALALAWAGWCVVRPGAIKRAARVSWLVVLAALALPLLLDAAAFLAHRSQMRNGAPHAVRQIVLLSADTLRADALALYGNPRVPTPALDQLARDGVVFENDISVAPWTLPSLSTLMSGVSPAVHLVRHEEDRLPDSVTTLAERFAAAGYHTAAIVDNAYLRPKANLAQGFDDYLFMDIPDYGKALGPQIMQRVLPALFRAERPTTIEEQTTQVQRWIARHAERDFFLWVHYFDPHAPYQPRRDYLSGQPPPGLGYSFEPPPQIMSGTVARSAAQREWIRALYEAEVRGVDDNVGRVLEQLRQLELYDGAVIAFTSDHGEEFWEHDGQGHGHTLFNEVLRVPLLIKLPDQRLVKRVAQRISSERIAASLLEAADVEFDGADFSGPSLLPLMRGEEVVAAPPVVSESAIIVDDQQAVVSDEQKYIRSLVTGRELHFDLHTDPGERQSRLADADAVSARKLLEQHASGASALRERSGITRGESADFDSSTLHRLRGLGYIK